jgi:hypothetical protein
MKNEKKSIEFIKNPSELTKEDLINIKGGLGAALKDCICKCGTNTASMQKSESVQAD